MKIELKEITVRELAKPYYLSKKENQPEPNLISLFYKDKVIRLMLLQILKVTKGRKVSQSQTLLPYRRK